MDKDPRELAKQRRCCQQESRNPRRSISEPLSEEQRKEDHQGSTSGWNGSENGFVQVLKRGQARKFRYSCGYPRKGGSVMVPRIKMIPCSLDPVRRDPGPHGLIRVHGRIRQIKKPQSRCGQQDKNPSQKKAHGIPSLEWSARHFVGRNHEPFKRLFMGGLRRHRFLQGQGHHILTCRSFKDDSPCSV